MIVIGARMGIVPKDSVGRTWVNNIDDPVSSPGFGIFSICWLNDFYAIKNEII